MAFPNFAIQFRAIKPSLLRPAEVRGRVLTTLQKYQRLMLKDIALTTATWVDHHPSFKTVIAYKMGDAVATVYTEDEIWGYLNRGTSERWAVMSRDWQSKTTVGQLSSGPGAGHVAVRGKKHMKSPMQGIDARNWTFLLQDKYANDFANDIRIAIIGGLRAARAKGKI